MSDLITNIEGETSRLPGVVARFDRSKLRKAQTRHQSVIYARYGVLLDGTQNNVIRDNKFNTDIGVLSRIDDGSEPSSISEPSSNNEFTMNFFNNVGNNHLENLDSSISKWSMNYWTNPNEKGHSNTCVDSQQDGKCDQPKELGNGNRDPEPLAVW